MSRLSQVFLVALLAAAATEAQAWSYHEHFSITYRSLAHACKQFSSDQRRGELAAVCNPRARMCIAHMVALSGDYVAEPSELWATDRRKLLQRDDVDCADLWLPQVAPPMVTEEQWRALLDARPENQQPFAGLACLDTHAAWSTAAQKKLIANPWRRGWRWLTLATRNAGHFEPLSCQIWVKNSDKAAVAITLQERIALHAFSLHFLQDSFAAGHIGLDRSFEDLAGGDSAPARPSFAIGRRQDYAHAYHDDLNRSGQFLQGSEENATPWFGYGDTRICAPTRYLRVPVGITDEQAKAVLKKVVELVGAEPLLDYGDGKFVAAATDAIVQASTAPSPSLPDVLSLRTLNNHGFLTVSIAKAASRGGLATFLNIFQPCSLADHCDKLELLLTAAAPQERTDDECHSEKYTAGAVTFDIHECQHTMDRVLAANTSAQLAFLGRELGDVVLATKARELATSSIPASYGPNDPVRAAGDYRLNLPHKVLQFGPLKSTTDMADRLSSAWSMGIVEVTHGPASVTGTMLEFGPAVPIDEALGCAVDLRFAIVDRGETDVSAPLNSGRFTATCGVFKPRLGWVGNLTYRGDVGWDALWEGSRKRNLYTGVAVGEIALARHFHWNSDLDFAPSTMLNVAVKVPSIRLATH
jgi:hypothetical protein